MPLSTDNITGSIKQIISRLTFMESPIVSGAIITLTIICIIVFAFNDDIKQANKKVIYKALISIFICIVVIIFIHDTLLLQSLNKDVNIPFQQTNVIKPENIVEEPRIGGSHVEYTPPSNNVYYTEFNTVNV